MAARRKLPAEAEAGFKKGGRRGARRRHYSAALVQPLLISS